jgi:hypothetical protein
MEMPQRSVAVKKRPKPRFKVRWVKLPLRWVEALRRSKSASTYRLAHTILFEAFKREQTGGEIVLSMEVTKMPSSTRERAAKELVRLGLIRIGQSGKQAFKVTMIL